MGNVISAESENQIAVVKDESVLTSPQSQQNKTEASDLRPELVRLIIENNHLRQQTAQMNHRYMQQLNSNSHQRERSYLLTIILRFRLQQSSILCEGYKKKISDCAKRRVPRISS